MGPLTARFTRHQSRERGISLIMALISLFILTLSALAMMMLMKGSGSTAANIAFRQAAVRVADTAVEDALTFINSKSSSYLATDNAGDGYYATSHDRNPALTDPNIVDASEFKPANLMSQNPRRVGTSSISGYDVYYVIHRMASGAGLCSDASVKCQYPATASSTNLKSGASFGTGGGSGGGGQQQIGNRTTGLVFYRVTVKVVGPQFNNRYIQAFVY